jgi:hypothetical protein
LTLSGVSSEDVVATGGQSGFVAIASSFKNIWLVGGWRADFWSLKIYSFSRMAALATVIANLVLLNLDTPVGCRVCTMFRASLDEIFVLSLLTFTTPSSITLSRWLVLLLVGR